ncbi:hypothetical protein M409DRAFT_18896 [Zasmidium cellare ATCC 36951]|uniref:tripeptidyl-peptidase II n=1 Tax=Zasmidium cellare ATCC 36951 TaxID=1080233 RepID=A0A6A6CV56_ZASCE|nr:uncharacterized protein M409DRAFT_18896 [Zasmidium cellare ATCC 36951]KAF2170925.1 hypothetical protein M409DRAFT_18896 [Zasmidium cellare ATCC 36951]
MLILTALLATCLCGGTSFPAGSPTAIHEERRGLSVGRYEKLSRVHGDAVVPVRIALVQSNIDRGYEHLMEVSHPSSASYGKHWTAQEVRDEFAPSDDTIDSILTWLAQSGTQDVRTSHDRLWIAFNTSASHAESLFATELHEYRDWREGSTHLGCDRYSVPAHLTHSIDYVTPGVKLSLPLSKAVLSDYPKKLQSPSKAPFKAQQDVVRRHGPPGYGGGLPPDLVNCGRNITPPCLRALYDVPFPRKQIDHGILGIYETTDTYAQADLDAYFAKYAPYVPQGTAPTLVSINNATAPVAPGSGYNGGESDVDFDIAYSLLGAVPITLYQVQIPNSAYANGYAGSQLADPILAAVDGAYCDEADLRKDGFQCGGTNLSSVLSFSYAFPESLSTYKVQQRACNEFMKLALQGHTIVVASGDFGVAGDAGVESPTDSACDSNGCLPRSSSDQPTTNSPIFNPSFPQSCPYVLSVGATQLNSGDAVQSPESVMFQPQLGSQASENCTKRTNFFTSGGGFSNYFDQPAYQKIAVSNYFSEHNIGYPSFDLSKSQQENLTSFPASGIYNRGGRGFPDVSANGANFNLFVNQTATQQAGTSLAAPIWSSIFALINQARKDAGKSAVGFVNPVLYENPGVFHDITKGSNPGCNTDGFSAVQGWDPVTGLGTPNFPALERLFLSLP